MFDENVGIVPESFDTIIDRYRVAYNEVFGKNLSEQEFKNSNWWKFFSIEAQQVVRYQAEMAALFTYYTQYINTLNTTIINEPKTTLSALQKDLIESLGYQVGIRWNTEDEAGQLAIYLDTEGDGEGGIPDTDKEKINNIIKERAVTGYHYVGDIEWTTTIVSGQEWYVRVNLVQPIPVKVKITFATKSGSLAPTEDELKELILNNFKENITIGSPCELTKVVNYDNCSWAGLIKTEQATIPETVTEEITYQDKPLTCNYGSKFSLSENDLTIEFL